MSKTQQQEAKSLFIFFSFKKDNERSSAVVLKRIPPWLTASLHKSISLLILGVLLLLLLEIIAASAVQELVVLPRQVEAIKFGSPRMLIL
jgi:hypothetical protein